MNDEEVQSHALPCPYCCHWCDEYGTNPDHSCNLCTQELAPAHESCLRSVERYMQDVEERKARGEY